MGTLFDSPWKIAIIALLIIVLFGAKKLPGAAKSLGQSMRILKAEVTKLHDDEEPQASAAPPAQIPAAAPAAPVQDEQSAQIEALQQQVRDLQRAAAMDPVASVKKDD
ncbi:MAG TPA: Sec-independent protein translocase subunit TatA [Streptosporangiaceae bacterium]|nr:Sec-independent protein translocase subunit TatA [Streptosporangiaceae bacterium]